MAEPLRLVLRTPHGVAAEIAARSVRFPSPTGLVGLRRANEPFACAVEPGLVVVDRGDTKTFAATAGGLVETDGATATLVSPVIVVGSEQEVLDSLTRLLEAPTGELAVRRKLAQLERQVLHQLRPAGPRLPATERSHGEAE